MYISDWDYVGGRTVSLPYGYHVADYNVIIIATVCAIIATLVCIMVHAWRLVKNDQTRVLFLVSRGMKITVFGSLLISAPLSSALSFYFTIYLHLGNWSVCDTGDGCILGSLVSLVFGILFSCFFFATLTSIAKLPYLMRADMNKLRSAKRKKDSMNKTTINKETDESNENECEA